MFMSDYTLRIGTWVSELFPWACVTATKKQEKILDSQKKRQSLSSLEHGQY
jgi:hypothetical protein